MLSIKKRRGRARHGPYYKLLYSDFITQFQHLQIDWGGLPSKMIYNKISDFKYGGSINYKNLTYNEGTVVIKKQQRNGSLIHKDVSRGGYTWRTQVRTESA